VIPSLGRPLIALVAGVALSLAWTPLVRWLALRFGFVNAPAADRWADRPTALLGGVAIAASAGAAAALAVMVSGVPSEVSANVAANRIAVGIVLSAGLMFAVGLLDDLLHLRPHLKFTMQVVGGSVLVMFGGIVPLTDWYPINVLISVFWFVAITNAVNLLDNMDGVAAGVAAIGAFFLGLVSVRDGSWLAGSLAWGLSGACLGFLRYNFKPASIFMGDAGSLFIGAVLAGLAAAVNGPSTSGSLVSVLFVPLVIVAVPIFDTALVTVTRAVAGRAFYQGGRDHTTHRLVSLGLTERQTALLLYSFALAGGLLSLWLNRLNGITALALGGIFLISLALLAAYLGHLRVEYANEPRGSRAVTVLVTNLLYKRRLAEIVLDAALLGLSLILAVLLRFDAAPPPAYVTALGRVLPVAIGLEVLALALSGVYRGAWRYAGLTDVYRILYGLTLALAVLFVYVAWRVPDLASSPGVLYTNYLCAAALLLSARLSFRSFHAIRRYFDLPGEPVIVYGAGDAGEMALRELRNNSSLYMKPVCLLDDDALKHGARIHGVSVVGGREKAAWALEEFRAKKIVIASTKLRPEVREELRSLAKRTGVALVELELRFRPLESSGIVALQPGQSHASSELPLPIAVSGS
jgi:UDP-GlcNAc:undecaprenyl-phosphate GlcNAc-1-phosphate transferase